MKRRHSLRLLIAATLLLVPSAALPCQCGDMPEDLYAAVFEGRVERISRIEPRWRDMRRGAVLALYDWLNLDRPPDWISAELLEQEQYGVNVTFRVTSYWKGVGGKTIDVRTASGSETAGIHSRPARCTTCGPTRGHQHGFASRHQACRPVCARKPVRSPAESRDVPWTTFKLSPTQCSGRR